MDTVEVDGVVHSYRRRQVLTGTSWRVGDGINALLGPNGAGKTTLLRCMVGDVSPKQGSVRISGHSVGSPLARAALGYVPQAPRMPGLCKVIDLVAYAAWLSKVSKDELDGAVAEALAALGVEDLAQRRVRTLSGGQRQRVAVAAGIVHRPRVLVLDEPTVGLDPGQRLRLRQVIHEIGQHTPVILSTHLTEDVEHLATNVAVLVGGKIQYHGPLDGLRREAVPVVEGQRQFGSDFERAYEGMMIYYGSEE